MNSCFLSYHSKIDFATKLNFIKKNFYANNYLFAILFYFE